MTTEPQQYVLAAWKLPLIVAAIVFSIVGGFYVGGAGLGLAVGALAASSVIVMGIRNPPKPAIAPPAAADGRTRLLLLVDGAIGTAAVSAAAIVAAGGDDTVEIFALVPLHLGLLDRWACDTGKARRLAEGWLAMVLSALRRAGVRANGSLAELDARLMVPFVRLRGDAAADDPVPASPPPGRGAKIKESAAVSAFEGLPDRVGSKGHC